MPVITCTQCGVEFERSNGAVNRSHRRGSKGQFCSKECQSRHSNTQVEFSCLNCGTVKMGRGNSTNRFCSRSCSASYNNRLAPKRVSAIQTCASCGSGFQAAKKRKHCPDCMSIGANRYRVAPATNDISMEELSNLGLSLGSIKGLITGRAKALTAGRPQVCAVTGYRHFVDVCHVLPIAKFSRSAKIHQINDPRNLVLLSPNAHRELDRGILPVEALPDHLAFLQYLEEMKSLSVLK